MIYRALLKNKYSKFSLNILEYCSPKKATEREQYYLDLLNPKYNILKKAGSLLGFKHSLETLAKMKNRKLTEVHKAKLLKHLKYLHGNIKLQLKRLENSKIYLHSTKNLEHLKQLNANPEFKAKRLEHLKRLHSSEKHKEHLKCLHKNLAVRLKGRPKPEGSGRAEVSVEVVDSLTNEIKTYPTIKDAAAAIGVDSSSICKAFKRLPEGESSVLVNKKRYKITKST
jgi:group I intron endonuclease